MDDTTRIRTHFDIEFNGQAREYFRIWIVNLLLSIVTLGIYSAWAKVRNNQYFYGNTYLDGSSFEYTAEPMNILKGRILAVGFLAIYQAISYFYPQLAGFALIVGVLLAPCVVVLALRFRMRYSRWRGVHFNFHTNYKKAYLLFFPVVIYVAITALLPFYFGINQEEIENMGGEGGIPESMVNYFIALGSLVGFAALLFPWWQRNYYNFIASHTAFGKQKFHFLGMSLEFYAIYIAAFGIFLGGLFGVGLISGIAAVFLKEAATPIIIASFMLPYAMAAAYIQTARTNTIYNNLNLGDICFISELKFKTMTYLYVTNTLAILLTLGLAIPWAKIRVAKYRAETMRLYADGFDDFSAFLSDQENARGEGVSDIFGWDVGF